MPKIVRKILNLSSNFDEVWQKVLKFGTNMTVIGKKLVNSGQQVFFDLDKQFSNTCEQIRTLQRCLKGNLKETVWWYTRQTDQMW